MAPKWSQPIDKAQTPVPSTWALAFTDAVAQYAQELWAIELQLPNAGDPTWDPAVLDAELRGEVKHLVFNFARAVKKQLRLDWTCESYNAFVGGQDGNNTGFERDLGQHYPGLDHLESGPATVVDASGVIALYFVPDALTSERQAQIFMSVSDLNPALERDKNKPHDKGSWRQISPYFRSDEPGLMASPGLVTVGMRQSQGHEKPGKPIHIASDLGGSGSLSQAQRSVRDWLPGSLVFGALMSAALAITHPEQYAISRESLVRLAETHPALEDVLKAWPFAFNAVAVVSNRATPMHRDRGSGDEKQYDEMVTIGGDHDMAIEFAGLGFRGRYRSVSESVVNERVAFAAFVKKTVQLEQKLDLPRAPTLDLINSIHVDQIHSRRSS